MRVDIYADGDLGMWALNSINNPGDVASVITTDPLLRDRASHRFNAILSGAIDPPALQPAAAAISIHYHKIFTETELGRYEVFYNLHPGLLPWGRGYYPVFWALWDQSPAGATLHKITAHLDRGPIVSQIEVPHSESDTGWSLHERVTKAEQDLFSRYWPRLASGEILSTTEQLPGGTYHSRSEFKTLQEPTAWEQFTASEIVRLARALTFPGYPGLRLQCGAAQYELSLAMLS